MKKPLFMCLVCLLPYFVSAQTIDSALVKKLSVNGFCLCQTTLSSLQQSYPDLKEVKVEEMDLAKGCYGQDSRYIAGIGYATSKQMGVIFQKDPDSTYISKIRLTKQFRGNLPDGRYVDLSNLKLRDLFKLYPAFKDKWGSRSCSNYWNFSNDTISFYLKIDSTKKPQFPIDEAYYMNKPIEAVDLVASCFGVRNTTNSLVEKSLQTDPILFMDSVRITSSELSKYNPLDIAAVTIITDIDEIQKILPGKKNELIYIETKKFETHRFWNYFSSKSPEFAKAVPSEQTDTTNVQYILNGKVIKKDYESDLSSINDKTFRDLKIINKKQLTEEYGITNKKYGVVITTDSKTKNSQ